MHTRASLIGRARRIRADIEQIFTDAASWNDNSRKPHEELIDPDPDGELKRLASNLDAMLEAESR